MSNDEQAMDGGLRPLNEGFADTRRALHLITFYAFSYARQQVDGEVWLTVTSNGVGTPPFAGRSLRFEGSDMVEETDGEETGRRAITTLRSALDFAGVKLDRPRGERNDIEAPEDLDEEFRVDADSVAALTSFFSLGRNALERVLAFAPDRDGTSVRLWNEHFDMAIELGDEATQRRASIGFSPGDAHILEPYVYVVPWWKDETADLLPSNTSFGGVALHYRELLAADDPPATAEAFIQDARTKLGHQSDQ